MSGYKLLIENELIYIGGAWYRVVLSNSSADISSKVFKNMSLGGESCQNLLRVLSATRWSSG